jgi:hypothetical protein
MQNSVCFSFLSKIFFGFTSVCAVPWFLPLDWISSVLRPWWKDELQKDRQPLSLQPPLRFGGLVVAMKHAIKTQLAYLQRNSAKIQPIILKPSDKIAAYNSPNKTHISENKLE